MESRQIDWFAPECYSEEMERKEGAFNATGRLDTVDWCRGLILPGLSDYADCRCRPMSELSTPAAPPSTS